MRDQVSHPYKTTGEIVSVYFKLEFFIQQTGRQKTLGLVLTKNYLNILNLIPNI